MSIRPEINLQLLFQQAIFNGIIYLLFFLLCNLVVRIT
jgi:hypothetical protein